MRAFFWAYTIATVLLALGLPIFSYLTLIYRELGRMTTGRIHEHPRWTMPARAAAGSEPAGRSCVERITPLVLA